MSYTSFRNDQPGDAQPGLLRFQRTNNFGSVGANNLLGEILWEGFDATVPPGQFKSASYIQCKAVGAPAGNVPSELQFNTSYGTGTQLAMNIGQYGQVDIANPATNQATLIVNNNQSTPNVNLRTANATPTNAPHMHFTRSHAGAGDVVANDELGRLEFLGFQGGTAREAAEIASVAQTVNGTNAVSGFLSFRTVPTTYAAMAERLRISADGNVTINAPVSGTALTIVGGGETITAGDFTLSAGNINLTTTTSSATGVINAGGNRFIHNYGVTNTFVGVVSGNFTLTGTNNTGLGTSTLANVTSGTHNTALAPSALTVLTTGSYNTAVGQAYQSLISGSNNIGIGYGAGLFITTGSRNIILGNYNVNGGQNYTSSESNNICIGSAGVTGESNTFRVGTATGTGDGQIQNAYIQGYVNLPGQPSFHAWISTAQNDVTGDSTSYNVIFQTERHDTSSSYNNATGIFTAPVTGKYMFTSQVIYEGLTAGMTWGALGFWVNGAAYVGGVSYVNPIAAAALGSFYSNQGTVIMNISAGDTVQVRIFVTGGAKVVDLNLQTASFFAGQLLS